MKCGTVERKTTVDGTTFLGQVVRKSIANPRLKVKPGVSLARYRSLQMCLKGIIIKFLYSARPDWLKQRALSEYRCTESRCHAISQFVKCLEFFLVLCLFVVYSDVLYNIENENELLASMDIDYPVRNSTNNTVG